MKNYFRKITNQVGLVGSFSFVLSMPVLVSGQNTFPSTGNVGIGTATPLAPLHINSAGNTGEIISSSGGIAGLELRGTGPSTIPMITLSNPDKYLYTGIYMDKDGNLRFICPGVSFTSTKTGLFGIGTLFPKSLLHLNTTNKDAILRLQSNNNGAFGSASVEFWSDPTTSPNEWRPGGIQSFDKGGFVGGLKFYTNGSGSDSKTSMKEAMEITDGKVIIGDVDNNLNSSSESYSLFVKKGILTERLKVAVGNSSNWADYVFDKNYQLLNLSEVENYIQKNKHLPGIPSSEQMVENGMDVLQMNAKLLEKVEELTLYTIELNKKYAALEQKLNGLSK